jgi:hypothetical protein
MSTQPDPRPKLKRPPGLWTYLGLIVGVMVIGGLAGGAAAMFEDMPGSLGTIATVALLSAAFAVTFALCVLWWRSIDEAAREAHKWAWWWGGSGGMAVGGVLLIALALRADDAPLPAKLSASPADLFAAGIMTVILFQLAGYLLAWAAWWLRHR